jgi:TP901 family phage tail tape measure protein
MRELKLKYILDLVSNVGARAQADARVLEKAQEAMNRAIVGTNDKFVDYNKLTLLAGKNTATMQEILTGATNKFAALDRAMTQAGHNTSIERQTGYLMRLGQAADRAYERTARLRELGKRGLDLAPEIGGAVAGGYFGARQVVAPPLKAYASLEQATMDLKVAMTNAKGEVAPAFDKIGKEAVQLGNELPGTTKDFMRAALALKANGSPDDVIANGGLRASAYLGVLLGLDQETAAVTIAKTREAYGLKDSELVAAADAMQKARFAYGLKPSDLLAANTYASGTLNAQKWSGMGNMREVLALQGLAAQRGIDGSVFGTDLKDFMTRLTMMDRRLEKKSAEAKHVRELLDGYGVDLNVIGPDGYLRSPSTVVAEMQKFNKLPPQDRNAALHTIFGEQGGQMAQLLAQTDPRKFSEMLTTQDDQAGLNMRLAMTTSTLANKFDALKGTTENLMAAMATQAGNAAKGPIDKANDAIGGPLMDFFTNHPGLGTAGLLGAGGLSAYLSARFGMAAVNKLLGRGAAAAGAAGLEGAAAAGGLGTGATIGLTASALLKAFRKVPALAMASDLFTTSDADLEVLAVADRMRQGYMGKGFNDPRRLDRPGGPLGPGSSRGLDFLTVTAPGTGPRALQAGSATELNIGQGLLSIDVRVTDDRATATTTVRRPMSLVRIDGGNTDPAGLLR